MDSIRRKVESLLMDSMGRCIFPSPPTERQFFKYWARFGRIIESYPTVDCLEREQAAVWKLLNTINVHCVSNSGATNWRPDTIHTLFAKINIMFEGRALVSVAEKWAYTDDDEWADAIGCFKANLKPAVEFVGRFR